MTFLEWLKIKKSIDPQGKDMDGLMDEHYDEYMEYLMGVKDGCGPK